MRGSHEEPADPRPAYSSTTCWSAARPLRCTCLALYSLGSPMTWSTIQKKIASHMQRPPCTQDTAQVHHVRALHRVEEGRRVLLSSRPFFGRVYGRGLTRTRRDAHRHLTSILDVHISSSPKPYPTPQNRQAQSWRCVWRAIWLASPYPRQGKGTGCGVDVVYQHYF